ncbi:unnamed protein product, partial [Ranitomeya imitator]
MTIQHSTESLQPEGINTTSSPKPIENVRESSTVTRKNTKATSKPLSDSIKLQNKSAKSYVTTQRPNFKTKPQNAITTKPIPEPTKKSSSLTTFNYLGNNYATDETHVHSKCPNRIRDKLRSKEFQNMFLEKIPVLQWKKHAQESEYERLKKYSGAQGWMGVTWEIINKTLNLLNSTGNAYMFDTWREQSPCIRCAVVGNGGILNGSGMGQEIDSHDYVFRMNGAITKGFEKDVGNRTSFFSFSTNTLMNSLYAYGKHGFKAVPRTPETRYVVLPDHNRDYLIVLGALTNSIIDKGRDKGRDPAKYFGTNLTTEHFKILHPDFMRYLRNSSQCMLDQMRIMRSKELAMKLRDRIVARRRSGQGYNSISAVFKVPKSTVASIILKWKKFGTTRSLPRPGRPAKLSRRGRRALLREVNKNPKTTVAELQRCSREMGESSTKSTITAALQQSSIYGPMEASPHCKTYESPHRVW